MSKKKSAIISVISGMISASAFIFSELHLLIFISISPTLFLLIKNKKNSFLVMFFYGFAFYVFADLWLFSVGMKYFDLKIIGFIFSMLLIILIPLILALIIAIPFTLIKYLKTNNPVVTSLSISFIYILGEWIHGHFPINFSWNRLCNIVASNSKLIQLSSILGGLFISFIIVLINLCAAYFVKYLLQKKISSLIPLSAGTVFFISNICLGNMVSDYYAASEATSSEVLVIQPDFTRNEKKNLSAEQILDKFITLSRKNTYPETDLIIFPETAVSERFFYDKLYNASLYEFTKEYDVNVLFGSSYKKASERYNSCVLLNPDGIISDIYLKRKLVPFGEYTPSFLPQNLHFLKSTYTKGSKAALIKSNIGKIGCCICFESIFPEVCRENSNLGAQMLVILTNDAWLGNSVPLYQHHSHSFLRAVENRKYTITCANTGISSVIASNGTIKAISHKNMEQAISADIYTNNINTFYALHGDIIIIPSIIILFTLTIIKIKIFIKKLA